MLIATAIVIYIILGLIFTVILMKVDRGACRDYYYEPDPILMLTCIIFWVGVLFWIILYGAMLLLCKVFKL